MKKISIKKGKYAKAYKTNRQNNIDSWENSTVDLGDGVLRPSRNSTIFD